MMNLKERKKLKVASLLVYNDNYNISTFNGKKSPVDYGLVLDVTETSAIIEWLADGEGVCEFSFNDNRIWGHIHVIG